MLNPDEVKGKYGITKTGRRCLDKEIPIKDWHQRSLAFSKEMFDKLLDRQEIIHKHVVDFINDDETTSNSSEESLDKPRITSGNSEVNLTFDESNNSILVKASTQESLDRASKNLGEFFSTNLFGKSEKENTNQLGLSDLMAKIGRDVQKPLLTNAQSWDVPSLTDRVHLDVRRCHSSTGTQNALDQAGLPSELFLGDKKKLESEDSSYDSDHQNWLHHDDVSRKISETLAAEFSEYVSVKSEDPVDIVQDQDYQQKVIYAEKLGYSETQLQKALLKVGKNAQQDILLEELVRLEKNKPNVSPGNRRVNPKASSCTPVTSMGEESDLLPIVIDGSNVAMSHGKKDRFSCKGIKICVDWFLNRGHTDITVFVPLWRKEASRPDTPISDQHILSDLERDGLLSFTPSRQFLGKRIVCHDDNYILSYAASSGAIVVSNDNFRDLIMVKPEYKKVIEGRILMYSFVKERFMPPDDPLGKNGPNLDSFLRRKSNKQGPQNPCPYGKKCTYGNKCKFYHAERGNQPQKSVTEKIKEKSSQKISEIYARETSRDSSPGDPLIRTKSVQHTHNLNDEVSKQQLCRTRSSVTYQWPQESAPDTWPSAAGDSRSFQSMHRAPPGPWGHEPPQGPSQSQKCPSNTHRKLARQLTLNPVDDPRIQAHRLHPPPNYYLPSGPSGPSSGPQVVPPVGPPGRPGEFQEHMMLTRNSSAPSPSWSTYQQFQNQIIPQGPQVIGRSFPGPQDGPQVAPPGKETQYIRQYDQMALHKTMSDSFVSNSGYGARGGFNAPRGLGGSGQEMAVNVSNEAQGSSGVGHWGPKTLGPIGSRRYVDSGSRDDLYYHLCHLFPEEQVRRAMHDMPGVTDPQELFKYIISLDGKTCSPN